MPVIKRVPSPSTTGYILFARHIAKQNVLIIGEDMNTQIRKNIDNKCDLLNLLKRNSE